MNEPAYKIARKRSARKILLDFIVDNVLSDYISYEDFLNLKNFVNNEAEERGEYGAFCDYFELGRWFEAKMEDCEFDIEQFYHEFMSEIERRAEE